MKRKQRENEIEELTEEAIVSKIYDELKSRSFVEQLRLECIADVKKKETYMKLQDRIKEYLTRKISGTSSTDNEDDDDFNTDVFRGQIVECGVLAITIEPIVDAVVTRKLHEELKPMISKMVKDFCRTKFISKAKSPHRAIRKMKGSPNNENSIEGTASFVRKICDGTQRDSKKIFEDSFVSKSLARVFNSNLQDSDEEMSSDLSSNEADNSFKTDELRRKNKRPLKKKKGFPGSIVKKEDIEPESLTRVKRERKFNPKYSPSLYQMPSMPSTNLLNGHASTSSPMSNGNVDLPSPSKHVYKSPVAKVRPSTPSPTKSTVQNPIKSPTSSTHNTNGVKVNSVRIKTKMVTDGYEFASAAGKDTSMYFAKKSAPKLKCENSVKAVPTSRRHPVTSEPHSKLNIVEDMNAVRKSGRSRKLNSLIFSDNFQGSPSLMDNVLAPKSTPNDAGEEKCVKLEDVDDSSSSVNQDVKPDINSLKRYDESDLYKPRPVIHSTGNRSRRV